MFGYASDETPELMPLTHSLATQLGLQLTIVRKNGKLPWVRPDGKTQVEILTGRRTRTIRVRPFRAALEQHRTLVYHRREFDVVQELYGTIESLPPSPTLDSLCSPLRCYTLERCTTYE